MKKVIYYNERIGVVSEDYPNAQAYISEDAVRAALQEYIGLRTTVEIIIQLMKGGEE